MIRGEELDKLLEGRGMLSVSQRLEHSPMDGWLATVEVTDLETLMKWTVNTRRSNMEMLARHDLDIHPLNDDIFDFIVGKSAMLAEFHINLRNVLNAMGR